MKTAFLIFIRLYWRIIPKHKRRKCLFKESCSQFVYRVTLESGIKKGLLALKNRFDMCRPGYTLIKKNGPSGFEMHLKNGMIIKEEHISKRLLPTCMKPCA